MCGQCFCTVCLVCLPQGPVCRHPSVFYITWHAHRRHLFVGNLLHFAVFYKPLLQLLILTECFEADGFDGKFCLFLFLPIPVALQRIQFADLSAKLGLCGDYRTACCQCWIFLCHMTNLWFRTIRSVELDRSVDLELDRFVYIELDRFVYIELDRSVYPDLDRSVNLELYRSADHEFDNSVDVGLDRSDDLERGHSVDLGLDRSVDLELDCSVVPKLDLGRYC